MPIKVNEEQIQWYKKPEKPKKEEPMEPSAIISARMIALNRSAAIFTAEDRILIGAVKRGTKKIILRAQPNDDDYTPFKCGFSKTGAASIRCEPFIQDVLVAEFKLDLSEKKRIKYAAEIDKDAKTVVIVMKE